MKMQGWNQVGETHNHIIYEHPHGHTMQVAKMPHFDEGGQVGDAPPIDTSGLSFDPKLLDARTQSLPQGDALQSTRQMQPVVDPTQASVSDLSSVPNDPYGVNTQAKISQAGLSQQLKGIGEQAAAEKGLSTETGAIAANQQQNQAEQLSTFKDSMDALNQRRQDLQEDIANNHIDPSRYLSNMGTGKTIATSIGLILGGMGGGLTHQENPVLKMLNQNIDRDIASQQADLNNKHTLLNANLQDFGNLKDATAMTKVMMNDQVISQLEQAKAKAGNPMAQAHADQAIGQLKAQNAPMLAQIAMRQSILSPKVSGPEGMSGQAQAPQINASQMVMGVVPKEHQSEAYKEIKQQQDINMANASALHSFDKVAQLQTLGARVENPLQASKQIEAEWAPMMDKLVKTNEGRVTPITVDLMNSLRPELTDSAQTTSLKRQKLMEIINSERSTPVLDTFNIKVPNRTEFTNQGASKFTPQAPVRPGASGG